MSNYNLDELAEARNLDVLMHHWVTKDGGQTWYRPTYKEYYEELTKEL